MDEEMNVVYEATTREGRHVLVSPATIRGMLNAARDMVNATRGGSRRLMNAVGRILSNFMFTKGYTLLVEIKYGHDGAQRRMVVIQKNTK